MRYFLEYNIETTRVLSLLRVNSDVTPNVADGCGLYEVTEDEANNIDTGLIGVQDGKIIKLYETDAERRERERLRNQKREQSRLRAKSMREELTMAILEGDSSKIQELRKEYRALKAYL